MHVGAGPLKSLPQVKEKVTILSHHAWLPRSAADFGDVSHSGGVRVATPDSAGSCDQGRAWQINEEKRGGWGEKR